MEEDSVLLCYQHWFYSCVVAGYRGDKQRPADTGVHEHLQRNNKCKRKRRIEDILCTYWNDKIPFTRERGILKMLVRVISTIFSGKYHALFNYILALNMRAIFWYVALILIWLQNSPMSHHFAPWYSLCSRTVAMYTIGLEDCTATCTVIQRQEKKE